MLQRKLQTFYRLLSGDKWLNALILCLLFFLAYSLWPSKAPRWGWKWQNSEKKRDSASVSKKGTIQRWAWGESGVAWWTVVWLSSSSSLFLLFSLLSRFSYLLTMSGVMFSTRIIRFVQNAPPDYLQYVISRHVRFDNNFALIFFHIDILDCLFWVPCKKNRLLLMLD